MEIIGPALVVTCILLVVSFQPLAVTSVVTSYEKLRFLVNKGDGALIQSIEDAIKVREERIKNLTNILKQHFGKPKEDYQFQVEHPNDFYLLVKHYINTWYGSDIDEALHPALTEVIKSQNIIFPVLEDFTGAALALVRLQFVYKLKAQDMFEGNYLGYLGSSLEMEDTYLMTSFRWKRKAGASVIHKTSQAFEKEAKDDCDNEEACREVDWLTLTPKRRLISLEDAKAKSQRLSDEAAMLAEAERYWEAIKKWDEALLLSPCNSRMLEMKTQALMAVGEVFPAVQTAQQAVKADPVWWVAWQTLGRAQLNLGEVGLAIRSFSKAVLLNPVDKELWEDDLQWACSVRDRSKHVAESKRESKCDEVFRSSSLPGRLCADASGSDLDEKCAVTHASNRTNLCKDGETNDIGARRDCDEVEVKQTVLNVPSNYVHLRG